MPVLRRPNDGIDLLEHTMKGVRNSENRGGIQRLRSDSGVFGAASTSQVRSRDEGVVEEREVVVRLPKRRSHR